MTAAIALECQVKDAPALTTEGATTPQYRTLQVNRNTHYIRSDISRDIALWLEPVRTGRNWIVRRNAEKYYELLLDWIGNCRLGLWNLYKLEGSLKYIFTRFMARLRPWTIFEEFPG